MNKVWYVVGAVVLLAALAVGVIYLQKSGSDKSDEPVVESPSQPVTIQSNTVETYVEPEKADDKK
jgi:hypothetical protein